MVGSGKMGLWNSAWRIVSPSSAQITNENQLNNGPWTTYEAFSFDIIFRQILNAKVH